MPPNAMYSVLTRGAMQVQASRLSGQERREIVRYLTGSWPDDAALRAVPMCADKRAPVRQFSTSVGVGWGIDSANNRSLSAPFAGLSAKDLSRLRLKWAFSFPDSISARSQPTVVGQVLYVGSPAGTVYAMNARSGCVYWYFQASGAIHGGVVYFGGSNPTLLFGDEFANVYSLNASTGALLWRNKVGDHPAARIAATPAVSRTHVFAPLSGWLEEVGAASNDYECCTFRGSVVALEHSTGTIVWKRFVIPNVAIEQSRDAVTKKPHLGPSGAGIWSSPAVDDRRGTLYFGTGNNYSDPSDDNSDAIFAVELATGVVKWKRQMLADDTVNDGCQLEKRALSCPRKPGPDADFSAPPILVRGLNGRDILVAGQKSGDAFGLVPDSGQIAWRVHFGQNSRPLSGAILYGMAVQDGRLFIPVLDLSQPVTPEGRWKMSSNDGVHALDAFTGKHLWFTRAMDHCRKKMSCAGTQIALLAIPGAVLSGSFDSEVHAFASETGKLLWRFNTAQKFASLNSGIIEGGTIVGAGALMVANGRMYVTSSGPTGSVLLALGID
jgi:polyvinyl alcohol dehydrogenase (cytochrome)